MKTNKTEEFEKEYYFEINDANCTVDILKKFGVKEDTLAFEVFLREIYGDVIGTDAADNYDSSAKKQVIKITENEKNQNKEFIKVCDEIDNSSFDEQLESLKF